jgi:uncharacterized membrane protein
MKYFTKSEWMILVGLFVLSFIPVSAGIFRLVELGGGTAMIPENPRVTAAPTPVVLHIISVGLYCYLGAFQFLPSIRRHSLKWHRYNGRLMFVTGIVSALSGLWMTHFYSFPYELQGDLLYCVRILLGSAMVVFIFLGLAAILRRDIVRHSSWMIRAYAIGQGASTQGLIIMSCAVISEEPSGLTRDVLMTFAWVINIFLAEWIIRKVFKKVDNKLLNTVREGAAG